MDNQLTINLKKLGKVLWVRGWYTLSMNLEQPEKRGDQFKNDWTDTLLKEYLEFHCGNIETVIILSETRIENNDEIDRLFEQSMKDIQEGGKP